MSILCRDSPLSCASFACVDPGHITRAYLRAHTLPTCCSESWWVCSLQRASRWLTHRTTRRPWLRITSVFLPCREQFNICESFWNGKFQRCWINCVLFRVEAVVPTSESPETGIRLQFILLMGPIKQYDCLKQLWIQGRIVIFIPPKLWLLRKKKLIPLLRMLLESKADSFKRALLLASLYSENKYDT